MSGSAPAEVRGTKVTGREATTAEKGGIDHDAHTLQTLASKSVSADAPLAGFEWKEEAQVVSTQDMGRIRSAMQNLLGSPVATRVREMVSGQ